MFNLTINNNYSYALQAGDVSIAPNSSHSFPNGSSRIITIPGMPPLNVLDIGETKIPGFPFSETWGLLFMYQTVEVYGRYEGMGDFTINVDQFADVTIVPVNGQAMKISLNGLSVG